MNHLLRRLIFAAVGVLLVFYGLYKILTLWAHRGWPMPGNLRDSLIGFTQGVSDWQRLVLYLLLAALPILYLELWRRGRRTDRLIRVSEGLLVQESAITGFLRGAIGALSEVQSITARGRMIKGRGLALNCHVEVESRMQIAEIQRRVESAARTCMAERLGVVPLADVEVTVKNIVADREVIGLASASANRVPTASPSEPVAPPPEPAKPRAAMDGPLSRQTIDLSPPGEEEENEGHPLPPGSIDLRGIGGFDEDESADEERRPPHV
ncbi:hypothetical protein JXA47_10450 [Candidatus Sumerlaeota bacterium]|nr:hypothetical protein [Candidatus Sumerlaeota bacterium]